MIKDKARSFLAIENNNLFNYSFKWVGYIRPNPDDRINSILFYHFREMAWLPFQKY